MNLFFVRSLKRYYVQCNGFIFSWYLLVIKGLWRKENKLFFKLGSVAGPVFQANGRLSFVDDLRSGGLKWTSIRTELANSMVTLGERTQGWLGVGERVIWSIGYIQQLKALLARSGICWWAITVVGLQSPDRNRLTKVLSWRDDNAGLGVRNNSDRGLA